MTVSTDYWTPLIQYSYRRIEAYLSHISGSPKFEIHRLESLRRVCKDNDTKITQCESISRVDKTCKVKIRKGHVIRNVD